MTITSPPPIVETNFFRKIRSLTIFLLAGSYFSLPFSLALHNTCFSLAAILALTHIFKNFKIIKQDPLAKTLFALFIITCITSTYSLSTWNDALGGNFNKYTKISLTLLFIPFLIDKENRNLCLNSFFIGMLFILGSTYLSIWFNLPWSTNKNLGWGVDHTVFGNYITQNIMMSFFTLLTIDKIRKANYLFLNILYLILAALAITSTLYLSNGRTGYLTLIMGFLAYITFKIPKKFIIPSFLILFSIVFFTFKTSTSLQHRYEQAKTETTLLFQEVKKSETPQLTSIGARWYMWMKSIELIQERPLTGWGLGSHGIKWCEKAPEPEWCEVGDTTPHNQFLFFFTEMGIAGFLWILTFIGVLFWAAWNSPVQQPLFMGFIAIFIGDSLVNASLWNAREYNFFMIMACLLYCYARFTPKNKQP